MTIEDTRLGSSPAGLRLLLVAAVAANGCAVYEGDLLDDVDAGMSIDAGDEPEVGGEDGMDVGPPVEPREAGDAAVGDARVGSGCRPSDKELCDEICPEVCNGQDDDCDRRIDEQAATDACVLPHAEAVCLEGRCVIGSCKGDYRDCDLDMMNGCEAPPSSTEHCGICGASCGITHGMPICLNGTCALAECDEGYGDCDTELANGCELRLDTLTHCGACDRSRNAVEHGTAGCTGMECQLSSCDTGYGDCDDDVGNGCETPLTTVEHCGACGNECMFETAAAACVGGVCVPDGCARGYGDCDGDPATGCEQELVTSEHCGACSVPCVPGSLAHVEATACSGAGACEITRCDDGWGDCDGEVDNGCESSLHTLADCGGCGQPCSFGHASASCETGSCELVECDAGWGDCVNGTSDGCETPLDTIRDCGDCGNGCSTVGGEEQHCSGGRCTVEDCPSGRADCDGESGNGCEIDIFPAGPADRLSDCGACGRDCGPLAHAQATCDDGACRIASCDAGWDDCDGNAGNGCETPLDTAGDCGSCGHGCSYPQGIPACNGGSCELARCQSGYADCNDQAGCETLLNTVSDCGGCGDVCDFPNAAESCSGGQCNLTACDDGWGSCDGNVGTGCETPLDSRSDCGGCGRACDLPHATESCGAGTCRLGSCEAGWADCDGDPSNGCETSLTTTSDCGGCGVQCSFTHGSTSCSTGSCQLVSCDAGWGDCDGDLGDGCEQSLNTLDHCGGCNEGCSLPQAQESCMGGMCRITQCDTLWGDCDMDPANGCEQDLASLDHCGLCDEACSLPHATESCDGVCAIESCDSGWKDCDGDPSNGCEQETATGSCFSYQPGNFDPEDAALDATYADGVTLDCNARFDSESLSFDSWCGEPTPDPVVRSQSNGPEVVILALPTLHLTNGSVLEIVGSRPVILAVYGGATLDGDIDVGADGTRRGPGALSDCGSGDGNNGETDDGYFGLGSSGGGGGGAGFGSSGADGGDGDDADGGSGGSTVGNATLTPLRGGCGGGRGGDGGGDGGGGGGALQLSASGRVDLRGIVSARGGHGESDNGGGGGGGGSGGAVLVEGERVVLAMGASLSANGGDGGDGNDSNGGAGAEGSAQAQHGENDEGGGGGGGGFGRIRIHAGSSCTLNGTTSPAASTSCP